MKVIAVMVALLGYTALSSSQKKQNEIPETARIERAFNSQWTFNYFPAETAGKGFEAPGFNDSRWPAISLPHTWNSYETTHELRPFTRSPGETGESFWWTGWGWYRKHFTLSGRYAEHKVFIEFEGVQKYCRVWVNGKYAGDHKGGYGSFDFDISELVKFGQDNVIAVAVSNLQRDEFRIHPDSEGSSSVSCGIYRNVKLVLKNKLYIPMQGAANHEGGTFILTPAANEKEGIIYLKTWVKNDNTQAKNCNLQVSIYDRNNELVQVLRSEAEIDPGRMYQFNQTGKPLINPHLWSPEDPYLYTVIFEVYDRKELADSWKSSFGFRTVRYDDSDSLIYLNGKKYELITSEFHPEHAWLGDAIPDWMTEQVMADRLPEAGIKVIRSLSCPGSACEYTAADRRGVIAVVDFSGIANHGFNDDEIKGQITELIRRDRNHPSILFWGFGQDKALNPFSKIVLSEDSTRKIIRGNSLMRHSELTERSVNKNVSGNNSSSSSGEPSKIVLKASHKSVIADRGAVFTVTASAVGSDGNLISGVRNNLKWSVSGPGRLAGPSYYASYADSLLACDDGYYIDMPATNIVRADGKPGKITVSVFSAGLASGSIDVAAEEQGTDTLVMTEPKLDDEGRRRVASSQLITQRLDEIPAEIVPLSDNLRLSVTGKAEFVSRVKYFIHMNNRGVDTTSIELNTLALLLGNQLYNNGGALPAKDFNYNADHYNTCRLIAGYISRTKLPALFRESLRKYYSDLIIRRGSERNAGEEMNWLNWIPSGGVVVIVPDDKTARNLKGVIYAKETNLLSIIKTVYPQFSGFSDEGKERALIFISEMNPYVHVTSPGKDDNHGAAVQKTRAVYTAEKGQAILIPEYKFISE